MNRRDGLLEVMKKLEDRNITCKDCSGRCCTYQANSMQITALETEDLFHYLIKNKLWSETLEEKFKNCIDEYRLDKEISTGKNSHLRRTYTCPFFKHESLGCPLPPEVKPYGCLAFNAKDRGVSDGENCVSNLELLKERESTEEDLENQKLKEKRKYWWDKLPIPVALLERKRLGL